jgi:hypothetical protein
MLYATIPIRTTNMLNKEHHTAYIGKQLSCIFLKNEATTIDI